MPPPHSESQEYFTLLCVIHVEEVGISGLELCQECSTTVDRTFCSSLNWLYNRTEAVDWYLRSCGPHLAEKATAESNPRIRSPQLGRAHVQTIAIPGWAHSIPLRSYHIAPTENPLFTTRSPRVRFH